MPQIAEIADKLTGHGCVWVFNVLVAVAFLVISAGVSASRRRWAWLMLAPAAAWLAFGVVGDFLYDPEFRQGVVDEIGWGYFVYEMASYLPPLIATIIGVLAGPRIVAQSEAPGLCPACRYDLRGSPAPSCPECGEDRRTGRRTG